MLVRSALVLSALAFCVACSSDSGMVETEASGSSSSVSAPDIDGTAPDTDDETPSNSEPVEVQRFELNVQTLGSGWEYELVVDVEEHAAIDFDKDVTGLPPGTARVTSSASPGLQQVSVTSTAPERMPPSPRTGVVAVWNDPGIDGVNSSRFLGHGGCLSRGVG